MTDLAVMQPLMPEARLLAPLLEQAAALVADCHRLSSQAGGPLTGALRPRLRAMTSYYTNQIEGQHTRPADIERALAAQFDADLRQAQKQRLALAHMAAEEALEQAVRRESCYDPSWVTAIHRSLYDRLPPGDRETEEGQGIVPGAFRQQDVTAGRHLAPPHASVPGLLAGWGQGYRGLAGSELPVIGVACSHHRLLWIHPFVDGNGRVARLHSHLAFHAFGLSQGLWSPLRGLARSRDSYYARLNNADLPRRNDLDGRGALSQEELLAFASYFLGVCIDQVRFMRTMLDLASMRERLADLLRRLAAHPWDMGSERSLVRLEALEALLYTAAIGKVERARFMAMTGLPPRTGRRVLASLLDWGLLTAASSRAPVAFAVPLRGLRFLFPRLWPEAEG
ncbi:MAG: Fic family protein [Thermodesulfobacteriota bacterium]